MQSLFKGSVNQSAGVVMNTGAKVKESHLTIMKGKGDYTTNYNSNFNLANSQSVKNLTNTSGLKKDLTANHFKLGYQENNV